MNNRNMMAIAGMLGVVAMSGNTLEVRGDRAADLTAPRPEKHQKKVHPRRNAHLVGAWRPNVLTGLSGQVTSWG